MGDCNLQQLTEQRIKNEVRMIDNIINPKQKIHLYDDDEELEGQVTCKSIEFLEDYKQVRVSFEGQQLSEWKGSIFYFSIIYDKYPLNPVKIQFPKEIRHQYIIQNTGIYCLPDWSERFWKPSTNLQQIINRVVSSFHENPIFSDYPVDLGIVQLSQHDKKEYEKIINSNKNSAGIFCKKVEEEIEFWRKRNEDQEQRKQQDLFRKQQEERLREEEARQKQKQQWEEQQKVNQQNQQYQQQQYLQQQQLQQQQFNQAQYHNQVRQQPQQNDLLQQNYNQQNIVQPQSNELFQQNYKQQNNVQPQFSQTAPNQMLYNNQQQFQQMPQQQYQAVQQNQPPKIKILGQQNMGQQQNVFQNQSFQDNQMQNVNYNYQPQPQFQNPQIVPNLQNPQNQLNQLNQPTQSNPKIKIISKNNPQQ